MAAEARRRWGVTRVWLTGTSNGTLSAASAAAQLPPGTVDGVVLSATVTRIGRVGRESGALTVNDVALANIRVPTLLLHHRDDACYASPFAGAESLRRRLSGASRVDVVAVAGGDAPRSGPCEPLAPHGFLGVEAQAVDAMVAWMAAGEALNEGMQAADMDRVRGAANKLAELFRQISLQLDQDRHALLELAEDAKSAEAGMPIAQRYRRVLEANDHYVEPMTR